MFQRHTWTSKSYFEPVLCDPVQSYVQTLSFLWLMSGRSSRHPTLPCSSPLPHPPRPPQGNLAALAHSQNSTAQTFTACADHGPANPGHPPPVREFWGNSEHLPGKAFWGECSLPPPGDDSTALQCLKGGFSTSNVCGTVVSRLPVVDIRRTV